MTTPSGDIVFGNELFPEHQVAELGWAKRLADHLEKHYPGYLWAVNVDIHGGMATIQALSLSGEWGCYVPMSKFINDPTLAWITRYGGEILERYRVHRGKADAEQIGDLERNRLGRILADHS